jgi:glutamyl-tRNA reductase
MRILLAGVSHKTASVEIRERIAIPPRDYVETVRRLLAAPSIQEGVVLSTCNRSEFYCTAADPEDARRELLSFVEDLGRRNGHSLESCLYTKEGEEAVRHLFCVAASLDSLVVGEPQILGQVKEAYLASSEAKATGFTLDHLFQEALRVGRDVRAHTEIGAYAVSVSSVAVDLAKKIFGHLDDRSALVMGVGETSKLTLKSLTAHGIRQVFVANRTHERSVQVASEVGGTPVEFARILEVLREVDVVVSSTASPRPLIRRDDLGAVMQLRRNRPIFLIDLAVPRDVEPECGLIYNVFLYNIDDLRAVSEENLARREKEAARASEIIEREVERFLRWYRSLEVVPTIVSLRDKIESIRSEEFEKAMSKLGHLPDKDRKVIEQFGTSVVQKILHQPTVRLKGMENDERARGFIHSLRHLFRLDDEEDSKT